MQMPDILALPVAGLAHADAVLWLWTTNAFMHEAFHCLEAWGFTPKTILTWDKVNIGLGRYLRNVTEHCIVAVRGAPVLTLAAQSTIIREARREHSRKPEAFYSLVEAVCPGSKVELFARQPRSGWACWGAEKEHFHAA
jgi:N6-adenosine-specific RNA methylase IME4